MVSLLGILRDEGKGVEEVAVVATHAVMKATPQMTCPATKWATVLPSLNVRHSTDETHHGSQIADGQGIFLPPYYTCG